MALHRVRARLVSMRIATINHILAFLIGHGITVGSDLLALKNSYETIFEQQRDEISPRMRGILIPSTQTKEAAISKANNQQFLSKTDV